LKVKVHWIDDRIFAEVKVYKKLILVRFVDLSVPDPKKIVEHISYAKKHNWKLGNEIRVNSIQLVDYAMPFIEASYRDSR